MKVVSARVVGAVVGAVMATAVVRSQDNRAAGAPVVTQAEFDRWKSELSNWGRWGKDDQRGTLNLITAAKLTPARSISVP